MKQKIRNLIHSEAIQKVLALTALIILVIFFSVGSEFFLTFDNIISIILATCVNGILALGVTFIIITGGIDLSLGTVMTFSSVMAAVTITKLGMPIWVGCIVAILTGATCGLIIGILIARLNLPPFIATLGMMMVTKGLSLVISNAAPVYFPEPEVGFKFRDIALGSAVKFGEGQFMIPNAVWIFVVMIILAAIILNKTKLGRYNFAIGSNEEATRLSGINVKAWKTAIYVVGGAFTGVAGIVMASRLGSAQPALGQGYELDAIAAVVIGGTSLSGGIGTISGTVIGAFIMSVLTNGLKVMAVPQQWQTVIIGGVLILSVLLDMIRKKQGQSGQYDINNKKSQLSKRKLGICLMVGVLAVGMIIGRIASKQSVQEASKVEGVISIEQEIVIPVIAKGFQHQFWQAVKMGAEQAGQELGVKVTFEGTETEDQIDKQLEMLQAALAKRPQAIALAALDSSATTPYLEQAEAMNIPVIGFDSGVDSPIVKTTCATDNYAAAVAAAHKMAELIGEEGKVGLVVHGQTSQSAKDRRDGFIDTLKEFYPNIEVLEPQYGDGDHAKSTEAAKAIITANPDIKGIYGANEGSAAGVINAVKELGKAGQIIIVGFDSGKTMIDAIRQGVAAGSITQDPVGIGYKAVEAAYKAYKGEENPEFIDTGYKWFDKTNIDEPEIQAIIYE